MLRAFIWAPLLWSQRIAQENLLLASMTEEEVASGEISSERMAHIYLSAGAGYFAKVGRLATLLIILATGALTIMGSPKIGALAVAIAPLALLQVFLFRFEDRSIIFSQYRGLIRTFIFISVILLAIILYQHAKLTNIGSATRLFLFASLFQAPLYSVLKLMLPIDMLLVPISAVGIGLAFIYV